MIKKLPPMVLFGVLSAILHMGFIAVWGLGVAAQRATQRRAEDHAAQATEEARRAASTPHQQARSVTRATLAKDLQADLAHLMTNAAPAADPQAAWQSLTNALDPALQKLARDMADPARTDADLQQELLALKRDMVTRLREQLAESRREETARRFEDAVRTHVAPAVAEAYRNAIERQVARGLQRDATNLVRAEERLHQRVVGEIRKQADLALAESTQLQTTLEQAATVAAEGRVPHKELAVSKGNLDRAELRFGYLAKAAGELSPSLSNAVSTVRTGELARVALAREVATNAVAHAGADQASAIRAGAEAAGDLVAAATRTRDAMYAAVDYDASAVARAALEHALAHGGAEQLESAFRQPFVTNTLPTLGAQLLATLQAILGETGDGGEADDATRQRLSDMLNATEGNRPDPMQPVLDALKHALGLHGEATGPHGPAGQARLMKMSETFRSLLSRYAAGAMAEAAASSPGERAVAQTLKGHRDDLRPGADPLYAQVADAAADLDMGRTGFFEEGGDALSFRSVRQDAIDRTHYADYASRSGYRFEQDAYAALTAGMQERAGAEGLPRDLTPATGSATDAPEDSAPAMTAAKVLLAGGALGAPVQEVSSDVPYSPPFAFVRFLQIPFRSSPISIDGNLADWVEIPCIDLPVSWAAGSSPNPMAPTGQVVRIAWDHTGLYFAFEVTDPDHRITQVPHVAFWDGDAVEIHVDGRNRKQRHRTVDWGQQFWVWPRTAPAGGASCGEAYWTPDEGWYWAPKGPDYFAQAASATATGWALEVHLPRERLRDFRLQPGRLIGLNLAVDTGTPAFYYLAGGTEVHPSDHPDTWGDALLAGSDGTLNIDPVGGMPPAAFAIGTRVRVRVSDADMNLNPDAVDRVMVVADGGSGDSKTLILEETDVNTGTFAGWLGTALNTGVPDPAVLNVFEGEAVQLRYQDQARVSAARAVDVTLTIHAAASIASL